MPGYSLRSGRRKLKTEEYRSVSMGIEANHVKWTDTSAALELVVSRLETTQNHIDAESLVFMSKCSARAINIFLEQRARNPLDMPHNEKILAAATRVSIMMLREALAHAKALAKLALKHDVPYNEAMRAEEGEISSLRKVKSADNPRAEEGSDRSSSDNVGLSGGTGIDSNGVGHGLTLGQEGECTAKDQGDHLSASDCPHVCVDSQNGPEEGTITNAEVTSPSSFEPDFSRVVHLCSAASDNLSAMFDSNQGFYSVYRSTEEKQDEGCAPCLHKMVCTLFDDKYGGLKTISEIICLRPFIGTMVSEHLLRPLTYLLDVSNVGQNMLESLNAREFVRSVMTVMRDHIDKLGDQALRDSDSRADLGLVSCLYKLAWNSFFDPSGFQLLLKFAEMCLTSPVLEKRIRGIQMVREACRHFDEAKRQEEPNSCKALSAERLVQDGSSTQRAFNIDNDSSNNETVSGEDMNANNGNALISSTAASTSSSIRAKSLKTMDQTFRQWFEDFQFVRKLVGRLMHNEILKQSTEIITWLALHHGIAIDDINFLWAAALTKQDDDMQRIFELVKLSLQRGEVGGANMLEPTLTVHVLKSLIRSMLPKQFKPGFVGFIKLVFEACASSEEPLCPTHLVVDYCDTLWWILSQPIEERTVVEGASDSIIRFLQEIYSYGVWNRATEEVSDCNEFGGNYNLVATAMSELKKCIPTETGTITKAVADLASWTHRGSFFITLKSHANAEAGYVEAGTELFADYFAAIQHQNSSDPGSLLAASESSFNSIMKLLFSPDVMIVEHAWQLLMAMPTSTSLVKAI
eukprot:g3232.t1